MVLGRLLRRTDRNKISNPDAGPVTAGPAVAWPFKVYEASIEDLEKVKDAIQRRNFEAAEAHLAAARQGLGDDQKILMASAEIALAQGDWPEAQRRWQSVIDRHPDTVIAYAHRALSVRQQGDVLQAAALYHDLIRRFPGDVGAPISLVHLLEHLDETQRVKYSAIAEAGLLSLMKQYPEYAVIFVAHAKLARSNGDLQTAYTRLCQAKELNRSDGKIWKEIREIVEILEDRRRSGADSLFQ